jgi:hypothetical protein
MADLALIARERLEQSYRSAFGRGPRVESPRSVLGQREHSIPETAKEPAEIAQRMSGATWRSLTAMPLGIRITPILLTDGVFEHAFLVRDLRSDLEGANIVFALARRRWPLYIGYAENGVTLKIEAEKALQKARRRGVDEIWLCELGRWSLLEGRCVAEALAHVYRPELNEMMR